ncbi:Galactoside 3(4)-L-fucosyltransferase [Seminavis robusta]|uniref:Fucosyltransferase n=1 Tax=Seminavis robusta TaxID=568900 RepID=A0A9N8DUZ8_9STRA|nr:Galactoside 3(4)-L-fucosyltransferase [Seminavis robusta]|eukprot:Sro391_g133140.1 Galactoside 3(4)-L-fucosyltransferase (551) ;mRNA; f:43719-45371
MRHRAVVRDLETVVSAACDVDDERDPYLEIFESAGSHHGRDAVVARRRRRRRKRRQRSLPNFCCQTSESRWAWLICTWIIVCMIMGVISCYMLAEMRRYGVVDTPAAISLLVSLYMPSKRRDRMTPLRNNSSDAHRKIYTILYWNQYWDFDSFQFGEGRKPFLDADCPVNYCFAVAQRKEMGTITQKQLASFDAILIHAAQFDSTQEMQGMNQWRKPSQRFIYMTMESPLSYHHPLLVPTHHGDSNDNFFNWTMTYRLDSDLPRPYGFFELLQPSDAAETSSNHYFPSQWQQPPDFLTYTYNEQDFFQTVLPYKEDAFYKLAERPKKVAWIASRCDSPSRREDYVAELRQYIPVDIMGDCGDIPCNQSFHQHQQQGTTDDTCTAAVHRDYKFYLSFENSLCQDYVTEKFFQRMEGTDPPLVVVMGGANYSQISPPHSHLNVMDYESPKELAHTLLELDRNNSRYLSYFWWMDHYRVHHGTASDHASTMCRLCEKLHSTKDHNNKVYPNVATWHGAQSQCNLPNVIPKTTTARNLHNNMAKTDDGRLLDDQ